jgi:hypothetical protein
MDVRRPWLSARVPIAATLEVRAVGGVEFRIGLRPTVRATFVAGPNRLKIRTSGRKCPESHCFRPDYSQVRKYLVLPVYGEN